MSDDPRRWRHLTVWLHVLSSVGWMTLALVLVALLLLARTDGGGTASAATAMARHLDTVLLAPLANASAATGLLLSLGTAWGLAQHRWVLAKFVITLIQIYLGIFVLSGALRGAAETADPPTALIVGTAAMTGAIAFQAWLSVAKPGGRTRWARDRRTGKLPVAAKWVFVVTVVAVLADVAMGVAYRPIPVFSLCVVVLAAVVRHRRLRSLRAATTGATAARPRLRA